MRWRGKPPVRILGPIPANAEAVIFADQAELLACLASDWCEGSITTHWWWQSLFKGADIANTILPAWLESPEYTPAVLCNIWRKCAKLFRLPAL